MSNNWIKALKELNKGKDCFCIPKKGSDEYKKTIKIMNETDNVKKRVNYVFKKKPEDIKEYEDRILQLHKFAVSVDPEYKKNQEIHLKEKNKIIEEFKKNPKLTKEQVLKRIKKLLESHKFAVSINPDNEKNKEQLMKEINKIKKTYKI
jgi:translation initiation factor IF-2